MTNTNVNHPQLTIKLFAAICLLSLSACGVSSGTMVKPQQVSEFAAGTTTYDDVITQLGSPSTVKSSSDGSKTASYTHASVKARPESFIPFVGAFVGGADSTAHTVNFIFNRNGILTKIDTQDTAIGSNLL